jgi:hypothetical protein
MIRIFKLEIPTKKDFNALRERIDRVADTASQTQREQHVASNALLDFEGKFDASMDFIGRNLPLKRKRKAFRKIVE